MSSLKLVQRYFDREAERFDAIYETRKPFHQRLVDRFRRVVVERFHLVCNLAPTTRHWSVLDVGCGSGRYAIALADRGAGRIVGVDVSESMIELARHESIKAGIDARAEFITSAFLDFDSPEPFDLVVAMGYYDYLDDPLPHLEKMLSHCAGQLFVSFPKRWKIRVPYRKMRFWLERGFVRFYSKREVGSGRQGHNPVDESSTMSIARIRHVAIPQFAEREPAFIAWCKRPGCPVDIEPLRWEQPGGREPEHNGMSTAPRSSFMRSCKAWNIFREPNDSPLS